MTDLILLTAIGLAALLVSAPAVVGLVLFAAERIRDARGGTSAPHPGR